MLEANVPRQTTGGRETQPFVTAKLRSRHLFVIHLGQSVGADGKEVNVANWVSLIKPLAALRPEALPFVCPAGTSEIVHRFNGG